jgi:DNA-binding GntR family transcriptional regulator
MKPAPQLTSSPQRNVSIVDRAYIALKGAIVDAEIINLSGSRLMSKTIENLFVHVRAIRRMKISQKDRASRSIADHMRIIQALERRDTELAERLVRQHSLDLATHVETYCDFLD